MFPLQSALNSLHGLESKQITGRQQIAERFRERNRQAQPHRRQPPFDKRVSFESKVTSNSIHNAFFELSCVLLLCGYLKISDTFIFKSIRTITRVSDSFVNERACLNGDISQTPLYVFSNIENTVIYARWVHCVIASLDVTHGRHGGDRLNS